MKVCIVVGARPNFMKMAPVMHALDRRGVRATLVHTGQHYDPNMSQVFFDELGMPRPDIHLEVGSGSHARQTAAVMTAFEDLCLERKFDIVAAGGDVNSTLAAALVAAKLNIPVAHVEAGLRSGDRTMPEEVNRVVTDHISEWLFASEPSGVENLLQEGIELVKVHHVGNCMVDTLMMHHDRAVAAAPWSQWNLEPKGYGVMTLHRPSNVDDDATLAALMGTLADCASKLPLIFPVHPRTRGRLQRLGLDAIPGMIYAEPLPYLTFLGLNAKAKVALTDSGGLQEETTALGVPCLTLRENTERPATIELGTNRLVGNDPEAIRAGLDEVLAGRWPEGRKPETWDGHASDRIAEILLQHGRA